MKTQHLTTNLLVMSVLLAAGCSKVPSQTTESSQLTANADTNSAVNTVGPQNAVIPAGGVNFSGIDFPQFLKFYAAFAEAQIDTNQLERLPPVLIHFENTNAVTRSELVQLLDKVLYDQAGIVASHSDGEHVVFQWRSSKKGK